MGVGICVVGMGLMVGLAYDNIKWEVVCLVSGLLFFFAGQLLMGKSKS